MYFLLTEQYNYDDFANFMKQDKANMLISLQKQQNVDFTSNV